MSLARPHLLRASNTRRAAQLTVILQLEPALADEVDAAEPGRWQALLLRLARCDGLQVAQCLGQVGRDRLVVVNHRPDGGSDAGIHALVLEHLERDRRRDIVGDRNRLVRRTWPAWPAHASRARPDILD